MPATVIQSSKCTDADKYLPSGSYSAICTQIANIGTHRSEFKGEVKYYPELVIVFELSCTKDDGRPYLLSIRCTNTLNEKGKLYNILTGWRGSRLTAADAEQFVLGDLLDQPCMLNVSLDINPQTGRKFNKIMSISPLPRELACHERVGDLVDFGLEDIDTELFGKLMPWVRQTVLDSQEMQKNN